MDDEDFREIVFEFADRLDQRLAEMEEALDSGAYDKLARLAHWLKGTGGMAGFADFTLPASSLEHAAKQGAATQARDHLQELRSLSKRILLPNAT
jgi:HPt (histidine-containing phosphotransfer) domain-containing protein